MFTITELLDTTTQTPAHSIPWGRGATLVQAMHNAGNNIADETDGMFDDVRVENILALYMQHTGSKLVIAYTAPEVYDPVAAYKLP